MLGEDTGTTPLLPPTTSLAVASPGRGLTQPRGRLGAGTGMGETPVPLPSWWSPLLSRYTVSVRTPRNPPLEPFPPSVRSSLLSLPGLPAVSLHTPPLPLSSRLGVRCSRTRRERVKAGAVPGRDGAEERGWDLRGRGALAGVGGPRRAPPATECRAPAPGLVEAEPRGPHLTRILAQEKPGSPGGEGEEVLGHPPLRTGPAPGRRTRGAAGRCLRHHETRDGSPLEVKLRSSRALAGRSRGQSADSPPPPVHTTCPLSPGTRRAAGRFGRGT